MVRIMSISQSAFVLLALLGLGAVPPISSMSTLTASNFVKYVNSTTSFNVSGTVTVSQWSGGPVPLQLLSWHLAGIDPACKGGEAGNRCGIHIHEGSSCNEGAGGHLFKVAQDPWVADINGTGGVYYAASNGNASGNASTFVQVNSNLTEADILGRAVVVHDSTPPGRRIACALLIKSIPWWDTTTTTTMPISTHFTATNFVKYVNSTTNFSVSGTVKVTMGHSMVPSQLVSWDLAGIDPACGGGESGNRCGIHIHEGSSCTEGAEGHLFKVAQDPWVANRNGTGGVYYKASNVNASTSLAAGVIESKSLSPIEVVTNLTAADIVGRAVIVHDSTAPGRRIACALLVAAPCHTTTTTTAAGFLSGSSAVGVSLLGLIMIAMVVV